jgi:hypothetical protein
MSIYNGSKQRLSTVVENRSLHFLQSKRPIVAYITLSSGIKGSRRVFVKEKFRAAKVGTKLAAVVAANLKKRPKLHQVQGKALDKREY